MMTLTPGELDTRGEERGEERRGEERRKEGSEERGEGREERGERREERGEERRKEGSKEKPLPFWLKRRAHGSAAKMLKPLKSSGGGTFSRGGHLRRDTVVRCQCGVSRVSVLGQEMVSVMS